MKAHQAVTYSGAESFVPACVPLVDEALHRGDRLIVLAASGKLEALGAELGTAAGDVTFVPTDEHGRNPSRITTLLHSFVAAADGRQCVGLNETVLAGLRPAQALEARMSEFLLNDHSLDSWALSIVCLYDTAALDGDTLEAMRQSHPRITGSPRNTHYLPDVGASMYATPLTPPTSGERIAADEGDLTAVRRFVRRAATGHGVAPDRVDDLVLAANEIVTNSLRYGGGRADITVWVADGSVVCEVRDRGHLDDPLAGRLAPNPDATSGRGLWLANHLCDLVQVRSSGFGTVVRLHVDI